MNTYCAIAVVDTRLHDLGFIVAQQKRSADVDVFDFGERAAVVCECSGKRQFDESGSGEHRGMSNHMIGQHGHKPSVQMVLPHTRLFGRGIAQ